MTLEHFLCASDTDWDTKGVPRALVLTLKQTLRRLWLPPLGQPKRRAVPHLSVQDVAMDEFLGGPGIRGGWITEIYGESATGKTQWLLQMALSAQNPKNFGGLESDCLFINTEPPFPAERLQAMCLGQPHAHLDRVHIISAFDQPAFWQLPEKMAAYLRHRPGTKLILMDSIAAPFRGAEDTKSDAYKTRSQQLWRWHSEVLKLVRRHHLIMVVTNQVTSVKDEHGVMQLAPTLGLSWSTMVQQRFCLTKKEVQGETVRHIKRIFGPLVPSDANETMRYQITTKGITFVQ